MIDKTKVFVIGFQKTGTTSLELALQRLGFRVYGGDKNLMKFQNTIELKTYIQKTLQNWDAVQDMPWPIFYKQLFELYPEAYFILTVRDPQSWIQSVVQFFGSIRFPLHQKIYGVPCAEGYESRYLEVYQQNNKEVQFFFSGKPHFLVMDMKKDFNYETLCGFLNIQDIPIEAFPHGRNNGRRTLPKYKWYRDLRSLYWNLKKGY